MLHLNGTGNNSVSYTLIAEDSTLKCDFLCLLITIYLSIMPVHLSCVLFLNHFKLQ